jgi:hypothetical protein
MASPWLAQHVPVDHISVPDNGRNLRIAVTTHRTLVDVGATNNSQTVVDNAHLRNINAAENMRQFCNTYLGMNVHLFCCEHIATKFAPVTQAEEGNIVIRLRFLNQRIQSKIAKVAYVDAFLPQAGEDRVRPTTNRPILTLEDDPDLYMLSTPYVW